MARPSTEKELKDSIKDFISKNSHPEWQEPQKDELGKLLFDEMTKPPSNQCCGGECNCGC